MVQPITVAALYIDARGHYPKMPGVDCWDVTHDATRYEGPHPIVAHPACGPWGKLSHMYRGGEGGPELAIRAVEQVRLWGGVLEHPAHSRLWAHCVLPVPGAAADEFGGWTERIDQSDFGHVARKPTRIYCVRVDREVAAWRPGRIEPTHWIGGGRGSDGTYRGKVPLGIRVCSSQQRKRTPQLCADWLVLLASTAVRA